MHSARLHDVYLVAGIATYTENFRVCQNINRICQNINRYMLLIVNIARIQAVAFGTESALGFDGA